MSLALIELTWYKWSIKIGIGFESLDDVWPPTITVHFGVSIHCGSAIGRKKILVTGRISGQSQVLNGSLSDKLKLTYPQENSGKVHGRYEICCQWSVPSTNG